MPLYDIKANLVTNRIRYHEQREDMLCFIKLPCVQIDMTE